ncbi:MAG: tetratricopeptide repeat protein, partial [Chloroflexota bacterium]|nr:tetratricopeptide repeat protein [Chloroflexota bacterium]
AFDGLDELQPDIRLEAAAEIAAMLERPGNAHRFIVSCRRDDFGLYRVWFDRADIRAIEPVTEAQAREYLGQWRADPAIAQLLGDDRIYTAHSTARALSTLSRELEDVKTVPQNAAQLLTLVVRKLLIDTESRARAHGAASGLQSRKLMRFLAALAFSLRTEGATETSREQAASILVASSGDDIIPESALDLLLDSGLIEGTEDRKLLRFSDPVTFELFAAYALQLHVESGGSLQEYVQSEQEREKWAPALELLYGIHPDRAAMLKDLMASAENPALVRLAVRCLAANEPQEAWSAITAAAELDAQGHYYLGVAFSDLGYHEQAAVELGRAVERRLDSADVHSRLGHVHEARADYTAARREYELALERDPRNAAYKRDLGNVLVLAHEYDAAARCLHDVIACLKTDCSGTQHQLGTIYGLQGRVADAIHHLHEAVAMAPTNPVYRASLGVSLAGSEEFAAAELELRQALELEPEYPAAHTELGAVFERQGKLDDALSEYQRACGLQPAEPLYHRNAGAVLRALGRLDEAERELSTAIELDGSYADVYNQLGLVYQGLGRAEDALESFQKAVELAPEQPEYLLQMGMAYRRLHQPGRAMQAVETATALDPADPSKRAALAGLYSASGRLTDALREYRYAIELSGGLSEYYVHAAVVQRELERLDEAEESLRRALDVCPDSAEAHYELGLVAEARQEYVGAVSAFTRATDLAPEDSRYLVALARSLRMCGELGTAAAELERARTLSPDAAAVSDELGMLALANGDQSAAVEHLRAAVREAPEEPSCWSHLGTALRRSG